MNKERRILVISGATGLMGRYVLERLKKETVFIRALYRDVLPSHAHTTDECIEWVKVELLDPYEMESVLKGAEWMIHLAGKVSFLDRDYDELMRTNVKVTANVVNACLENEVKICHMSSVAAIGRPLKKEQTLIAEDEQWNPTEQAGPYAESKHMGEREVWRGFAEGLQGFIVNPSVILGIEPSLRSSVQMLEYVYKERSFYPLGDLNYVDAEDVAEVIWKGIEKNCNEERFIVNAGYIPFQVFFNEVSKRLNKKAPFRPMSNSWGKVASYGSRILSFLGFKVPIINKYMLKSSASKIHFDNSKVKRTLSLEFRTLEESLDRICTEFKEIRTRM